MALIDSLKLTPVNSKKFFSEDLKWAVKWPKKKKITFIFILINQT